MDERRRVSAKQEREVARRFGAQQHAGSGSGARKHDSHTSDPSANRTISSGFLIECKTTVGAKKQITIKADDLVSVERAALRQGRTPVLIFDVGGRRYACLSEDDFHEMSTRGSVDGGRESSGGAAGAPRDGVDGGGEVPRAGDT